MDSYHTANEVKEKILEKIQMNFARIGYFALYEVCIKKDVIEERYIENDDKIMDVLSLWEIEKEA